MSRTALIEVDVVEPGLYDIVIDNFTSATSHRVALAEDTYARLGGGRQREDFIRDAVRFLLTREPMENILKEFDIEDSKKYSPTLKRRLQNNETHVLYHMRDDAGIVTSVFGARGNRDLVYR